MFKPLKQMAASMITAAASFHHANDALAPSSHSPTESSCEHSAIDLTSTSPPRTNKRPAPVEPNLAREAVSATRRVEIGTDEERLCRDSRTRPPADATPVPDPTSWFFNMSKPTSQYRFNPVDTLSSNTGLGRDGSHRLVTYGSHASHRRDARLDFLKDERIDRPNTLRHNASYASKRRKTKHLGPRLTSEVIDLDDGPEVEVRSPPSSHPRRPATSHSQCSGGSRNTLNEGARAHARSELQETIDIANPHRKKARHRSEPEQLARVSHATAQQGTSKTSPITVDDESTTTLRRTAVNPAVFVGFEQGKDSQAVISKHFLKPAPMINHSTSPPRAELDGTQRSSNRTPSHLRTTFKRAPDPIDDFDELASPGPRSTKRSKLVTKPSQPDKADSKGRETYAMEDWPLDFARSHNYEGQGQDLFLRFEEGKQEEFIIFEIDKAGIKFEIPLSLRSMVEATADNTSRIRLMGSLKAGECRRVFDLDFANENDFRLFRDTCVRKAVRKIILKGQEYMQKLFSKPLETVQKPAQRHVEDPVSQSLQVATGKVATNGQGQIRTFQDMSRLSKYRTERKNDSKATVPATSQARNGTTPPVKRLTRTTRASDTTCSEAEKRTGSPGSERFSIKVGLGKPWTNQLTYGSGRQRAVVDFTDLLRLDEGEFLNDQLIDFYMIWLANRSRSAASKVYFFNTHFFSTLTRKVTGQKGTINYSAVARWTSKEDIFGYDYIVVPINQDVHWYLAVICNVSNISRKPILEEANGKSTPGRKATVDPAARQPGTNDKEDTETNAKVAETEQSNPPPTLVSPTKVVQVSECDDDTNLFEEEESKLNLVDGTAADSHKGENREIPDNQTNGVSPTGACAKFEMLSIADTAPTGILPTSGSSPASPKRTKRKPGPPVKKWDSNEPTIIVLDSLGGGARSQAVRALKDYIREEGRQKRGMEAEIKQNAYYAKSGQIPMQENFSDCGVYLLGYAQKFFEDPDSFKERLLTGEMRIETDWPEMPMPEMRNKMREILLHLYKQQDAERQASKKLKKTVPAPQAAASSAPPMKNAPEEKDVSRVKSEPPIAGKSAVPISPTRIQPSVASATSPYTDPLVETSVEPPKPRLGSPFHPQPVSNEDLPRPFPGKSGLKRVDTSSAPSIPARRSSPKVVIQSKSPHKGPLPGQKEVSLLGSRTLNHESEEVQVLSPSKRKRKADVDTPGPKIEANGMFKPQSNAQSLSAGSIEIEIQSPKKRRTGLGLNKSTSPIESSSKGRTEKHVQDLTKIASKPKLNFSDLQGPAVGGVRYTKSQSPPQAKITSRSSPLLKKISRDTRGSSHDPIRIDDSQDAILMSPQKTATRKLAPSTEQEWITITSPKAPGTLPSHGLKGPCLESSVELVQRPLSGKDGTTLTGLQNGDFVGDALLSKLGASQQEARETAQQQVSSPSSQAELGTQKPLEAEDDFTDFEGFSPLRREDSESQALGSDGVLAEAEPEDATVPETPPTGSSSPARGESQPLQR